MKIFSIERKDYWDGEYKKYRSTDEHIRQNQEENRIQRERDQRAVRNDGSACDDPKKHERGAA